MWYGGIPSSQSESVRDKTVAANFVERFNYFDSYRIIYNVITELPMGYTRARLAGMIRYYLRFGDVL